MQDKQLFIIAIFVLSVVSCSNATVCPKANRQCDKFAPCCNRGGYCSADPIDCLVDQGCQQNASYTGACIKSPPKCKSFREDFNDPSSVRRRTEYDGDPDKTRFIDEFNTVKVENGFMQMTHAFDESLGHGKITRVTSTRWFRYGRFSARLRTSLAPGLVNSFIYDSSADSDHYGDEIDYEWVHKDRTESQTNYYIDGIIDYTRGVPYYFNNSRTDEAFHLYEIEWLPNSITWIIDGVTARTVRRNGTDPFPDDFGRMFLSIWDTCKMPQGTKEWAGGEMPWCATNAPASAKTPTYTMMVDYVEMKCYEEDTTPTKEYIPITPKSARRSELGGRGSAYDDAQAQKSAEYSLSANLAIVLSTFTLMIFSLYN
ncbi:concanavalin A-like lectin/glucanase domain-containing protein [Paraphysoderma sedebokerense]|nr:concanavalin A-like lectin/glucanase domain-containing protein [Paraphysoderma sedebokerense]